MPWLYVKWVVRRTKLRAFKFKGKQQPIIRNRGGGPTLFCQTFLFGKWCLLSSPCEICSPTGYEIGGISLRPSYRDICLIGYERGLFACFETWVANIEYLLVERSGLWTAVFNSHVLHGRQACVPNALNILIQTKWLASIISPFLVIVFLTNKYNFLVLCSLFNKYQKQ